MPLYLHPTFPPEGVIEPYSHYGMMGAMWGFGAETSLHVVRMIMGGVFDAFPTLKVVLGHLGETLTFYGDRLGLKIFRKHLGWYVERAPWPASPETRRQAKSALCRLESAGEVEAGLSRLWTEAAGGAC